MRRVFGARPADGKGVGGSCCAREQIEKREDCEKVAEEDKLPAAAVQRGGIVDKATRALLLLLFSQNRAFPVVNNESPIRGAGWLFFCLLFFSFHFYPI